MRQSEPSQQRCLYDPSQERDACGVGFVAHLHGDRETALPLALESLARLAHRGGVGAENQTGDGAGVLTEIPRELLLSELKGAATGDKLAAGVFFFPRDPVAEAQCRSLCEKLFHEAGIPFLGWRPVPVNPKAIGPSAERSRPRIVHALLVGPRALDEAAFERRLYLVRRRIERAARELGLGEALYVASLSCRTIVYKGLLKANQLAEFYPDLQSPLYRTRFVLFHQRYSTNTTPSWRRAQPLRMLAHNGEINTLQGNVNWMKAREKELFSELFEGEALAPVIDESGSDSAMLDNALELLTLAGRSPLHAAMMLVPEAWEGIAEIDPVRRSFYRYHACLVEPWDGPAALVFTDGRTVGAALDRNGLRPLRYLATRDGLVIAASEVGTVPVDWERVVCLGKLGPGQMIAVDLEESAFLENDAVKALVCGRRPYAEWLRENLRSLRELLTEPELKEAQGETPRHALLEGEELTRRQAAFGYTSEELTVVVRPMVENAKEPNGSMGDDTPPAVLSQVHRPLFHYFKERFAEVTNPPIDHLRERLVFSLRTLLGARGNLLSETPGHARLVELESPILYDEELDALRRLGAVDEALRCVTLDATFDAASGPGALEPALDELCQSAEEAADAGARLLVLSDRAVGPGRAPIPSLLAVGAVHHHLIRRGKRMRLSLIVESGEPREVHHFAALIGYGAQAVNPYLAFASAASMVHEEKVRIEGITPKEAIARYRKAVEEGLLKVMAKMGISTVDSYCGAQIFEAIGIGSDVIAKCFANTPSSVEGKGFPQIAETALAWHAEAFKPGPLRLGMYGFYKPRKGGEFHEFTPESARQLQAAVRLGSSGNPEDFARGYQEYKAFAAMVHAQPSQLRDLLEFKPDRKPIPLDEVEPEEAILARFSTAQMSLGALSPEAHETLAIAMNRIGARSGSGEGGEDPVRFGTVKNSAVKQVASGRFGVTPAYLASAQELQIKMAQGSKPGEGGQIPGHKVTELIARLRHTVPGVALISPPPHHDIYSIEDLAQLIYDLKQVNPEAEVSVKLVSQSGVGIIAAGVAKGYADTVLISGSSGGTGSSPLNSIKNAGLPWEIGIAETQQALLANGLRERVGLRVDGGMKSGRDVLIAALLGADEFSFGTAAMIAEGCIMARVCHTNNCPVGVASQKPELRRKFSGTPEMVETYFRYVARHVRELLAELGYPSLSDVIGRTDLLVQRRDAPPSASLLDLTPLLAVPEGCEARPRRRMWQRNPLPAEARLDTILVERSRRAITHKEPVAIEAEIENIHRSVGATLSWEIARRWGDEGLPPGTIRVRFFGVAGQSFGAFLARGVQFELVGLANDYVGKGLAGGEIVLVPPPGLGGRTHECVVAGNTLLYGATGGSLFVAGRAGERFAVRNSGALAVVEGVGDHACEYMTGGTVVILGPTGYNFAAGMTGGEAFVFDEERRFLRRLNDQLVTVQSVDPATARRLRKILLSHYEKTGSEKARALLADWERALAKFLWVTPRSEVGNLAQSEEGAIAN